VAERKDRTIVIRGAREHNLKDIDLEIPRGRLTVITGVSGSGKSSLAFDTLFREGQRRFLETLPAFSRQFAGGFARPSVTSIEGLGPAVAVSQRAGLSNPRSTVGTLTEIWDLLRLLYARLGSGPAGLKLTRGLFSFNGGEGACPHCQGLGVEDRLDLELLVADASKSLRGGALRVSTPNGYLMYSQVTLAVLDEVLKAHGGSVDIPWQDLSEEVRQVVLYGSKRLRVPYGKHPLESRLKWTGITARPRQEGFYRGLVPVMEEILRGKRNDSILRFVRTSPCSACGGARLKPEARSVLWQGRPIQTLGAMTASEMGAFLSSLQVEGHEAAVLGPIRAELTARCELMTELGLGYLTFDRPAPTLSLGETQRLRLLSLAQGELRGLLVVLDEPSAGLHPQDVQRLLKVLRRLRDQGQTVVVVEHDPILAMGADWLIDLGPGPGATGGEVQWSGPPADLKRRGRPETPTWRWLQDSKEPVAPKPCRGEGAERLAHLCRHNLKDLSIEVTRGALNVIHGVSGAGKTSLLEEAVAKFRATGAFPRILTVDASPIGRTPRSNAATYSGAFDLIRDLFAATADAKARGLGKGHFTFNTAGGRCEACEGAGVIEVGMHHLGSVELICEACEGRRFHPDVLAVRYLGCSVADVLAGSIQEAAERFADQPKLRRILNALLECGLGYLPLGQPATTLSGGEAQRVKLATELARAAKGASLIALDEPTTGLHAEDVHVLLEAWNRLIHAGHTLLVVDNDLDVVRAADHRLALGPGSGPAGGCLLKDVDGLAQPETEGPVPPPAEVGDPPMELTGVTTHNLKGVDVAIPSRGLTVVTGPSGSGKSSLVFDTLLAEAQNRFNDLVSPWARRLLPRRGGAELVSARNLQAAVAVPQQTGRRNPRSRVGTVSELDELLRMLFSRAGARPCPACGQAFVGEHCACGAKHRLLWASAFSPNSEAGACPHCKGLGFLQACDPGRLVSRPDRALGEGALAGTRFGSYLEEPDGQYLATLRTVGLALGLDFSPPWVALSPQAQAIAMHGAGDRIFEVAWHYKRGKSEGVHHLSSPWAGFATLVDREYERVHLKPEGEALAVLLADRPCSECGGERLKPEPRAVTLEGRRFPQVLVMTLEETLAWLQGFAPDARRSAGLRADLSRRLRALLDAGLGYLSADREIATLSGGEAQRLRLASALGGGLTGVTYVLDEPTQGLHPRDTARLLAVLRGLAEAGNAVVVVEHEAELVAQADYVIELGPGAGPSGGLLLAAGPPATLLDNSTSRVGRMLRRQPEGPAVLKPFRPGITLWGAHRHNLQNLDVVFPLGLLTAVTGVSGSGKSTLVQEVLGASLLARSQGRGPVGCEEIRLHEPFDGVLQLDQGAPSAGGASTVGSLLGLAEPLRKRFAATPEARLRKLAARDFSTAGPGGRCETCEGRGVITVAMDLLPDVVVGCETCQGQRFQPHVLACRLAGKTITEVLEASVDEALSLFAEDRIFVPPLQALAAIGLGYLRLGQEARTLSAGEFQRLRLAGLLAEKPGGRLAILLDEPTRGLACEDVDRLLAGLRKLAEAGHLVVVVEHDLGLIARADWIIDLGPEAGPEGGRIVVQGPPAALVHAGASYTGQALAARA
jgi:excinuclease ABC subunit A